MKINKKITTKIISSILTLLTVSCNTLTTTNNQISTQSFNKESDIINDEINCSKERDKTFNVKSETDNQDKVSKVVMNSDEVFIKPRFSEKPELPPYSRENATPSNVKEGSISLIFKDEYKVRIKNHDDFQKKVKLKLDTEKNNKNLMEVLPEAFDKDFYKADKLESLNQNDVSKINNILRKYNVDLFQSIASTQTQEQADETERLVESNNSGYDSPNAYSTYTIEFKNIDLVSFINELRSSPLVREANYYDNKITVDTVSYNDTIFQNGQTFNDAITGSINISEQTRYHFPRVDAYKALKFADEHNLSPVAVAVIDFGGFEPSRTQDKINYVLTKALYCDSNGCYKSYNCTTSYCNQVPGKEIFISYSSSDKLKYDHGEQVASVIGSPADSVGVRGLASNTDSNNNIQIIPIRATTFDGVKKAIEHIYTNYPEVKIVNASLSYTNILNQTTVLEDVAGMKTTIKNAYDNGVLVVTTAGNINTQSNGDRGYSLVVGATEQLKNEKWPDSGYGRRIDISAPGVAIPVHKSNQYSIDGYSLQNGTSHAAPMVSATAAWIMGMIGRRDDGTIGPLYNDGTSKSVEKVKNILFGSGTLIQAQQPMGLRNNYFGTLNPDNTNDTPNGTMLNMYNALYLAYTMDMSKNYVRIFNTDYYSEVGVKNTQGTLVNTLKVNYKEDKFVEIPTSGRLEFDTYNKDCVYSWGYQVWNKGIVKYEKVKGIAGKRKPSRIGELNPTNNVISSNSSDIHINQINSNLGGQICPNLTSNPSQTDGFVLSSNGYCDYQGPNLIYNYSNFN